MPDSSPPTACRRRKVKMSPIPGASLVVGLSLERDDEPPMNMSVNMRAICFASPYFTR